MFFALLEGQSNSVTQMYKKIKLLISQLGESKLIILQNVQLNVKINDEYTLNRDANYTNI